MLETRWGWHCWVVCPGLAIKKFPSSLAVPLTIKPLVLFVERFPVFVECTPSMFNMEPENNDFQKGLSFSRGWFSGESLLNFRGVSQISGPPTLGLQAAEALTRSAQEAAEGDDLSDKMKALKTWASEKVTGKMKLWWKLWFWFVAVCSSPLWSN